jgi:hypothetical protein
MKDYIVVFLVIIAVLAPVYYGLVDEQDFIIIQKAQANTEVTPMERTQNLYDQALDEIAEGYRGEGCDTLRMALYTASDIDDDWETYNTIWNIGYFACNWIKNPTTVVTSTP